MELSVQVNGIFKNQLRPDSLTTCPKHRSTNMVARSVPRGQREVLVLQFIVHGGVERDFVRFQVFITEFNLHHRENGIWTKQIFPCNKKSNVTQRWCFSVWIKIAVVGVVNTERKCCRVCPKVVKSRHLHRRTFSFHQGFSNIRNVPAALQWVGSTHTKTCTFTRRSRSR